jgi:hypothetical protein
MGAGAAGTPRPPPAEAARRGHGSTTGRAAARGDIGGNPLEAEVLYGVGIDLLEGAVALAGEIARIAGPLILERLQGVGGIQPGLAYQKRRRKQQGGEDK